MNWYGVFGIMLVCGTLLTVGTIVYGVIDRKRSENLRIQRKRARREERKKRREKKFNNGKK